ncbi:MAG: patatin-like phospholipase family protein [Bacteroidota bacterium]
MHYSRLKHFALFLLLWANIGYALADTTPGSSPIAAKQFRILSIDGGGVRGVIPARILQAIEEKTGKHVFELFDLVVGTSTGGLVALALLTPDEQGGAKYSASDLVDFYQKKAPQIFSSSLWHSIQVGWGLWGPKYSRKNLDKSLQEVLGNARLSETLKPAVIVSYSLDKASPHLWATRKAHQHVYKDYYLRDVAGATSAAPTYFPPKVLQTTDGKTLHEIDGGIWANNPESVAIAEQKALNINIDYKDVILVSIGTGRVKSKQEMLIQEVHKLKHAGIIGWLLRAKPNLIDMMMSADNKWAKQMTAMFYPNTHRIQVPLPPALSSMDDSQDIDALKELAEAYILENDDFIHRLCTLLAVDQPNKDD